MRVAITIIALLTIELFVIIGAVNLFIKHF
jgi:hypothetical protein